MKIHLFKITHHYLNKLFASKVLFCENNQNRNTSTYMSSSENKGLEPQNPNSANPWSEYAGHSEEYLGNNLPQNPGQYECKLFSEASLSSPSVLTQSNQQHFSPVYNTPLIGNPSSYPKPLEPEKDSVSRVPPTLNECLFNTPSSLQQRSAIPNSPVQIPSSGCINPTIGQCPIDTAPQSTSIQPPGNFPNRSMPPSNLYSQLLQQPPNANLYSRPPNPLDSSSNGNNSRFLPHNAYPFSGNLSNSTYLHRPTSINLSPTWTPKAFSDTFLAPSWVT